MKVVVVTGCDDHGNIDVDRFTSQTSEQYSDRYFVGLDGYLSKSTHGVFEAADSSNSSVTLFMSMAARYIWMGPI